MSRLLVDGWNVIGQRPTGWWRDRPRAAQELVRELERLAAAGGDEVTLVLDGKPLEIEADRVNILFAPGGPNAADDEITGLVERAADPSESTVATSDATLADCARALGAAVMSAGDLRRRLDRL